MAIPKAAVLVTGLAAAVLVATINPAPVAQAFPTKNANCTGCHDAGGSTTAAPSTTSPAAGATYTVAITLAANPNGGNSGYAIIPVTAGSGTTNGGNAGADLSFTANMTAPAAAGTYVYNVYTDQGGTNAGAGQASGTTYSITVAAAPVVVTTSTALAVTPASPVLAPANPTLTATVSGAGAVGSVEFFNGTTSLGTVAVTNGVASKTLSGIAVGSYAYKAVFTPTNAALFTASTSPVSTYVVNAAPPVVVTTTTALAVSPASPVVAPASPTLTATVTGAGAAGTVQFLNGTTVLGTSTVTAGTATLALNGVVAGSYSYTAKFIPTNATAFTPSTSSAVAYVVTVPAPVAVTTTTALAVSPASPVVAPASPTLTATVSGAGAVGSVEFFNGTTSLGTVAVTNGVATKPLLGVVAGTYSYTAKFIPTNAAAFTPSTSSAVAYVVTLAPPVLVTTTTTLAVTPASPAVAPASPTLTATVSGAGAVGSVEFFNGTTSLGTVAVTNGVATKPLLGVVAGTYSYTAKFIPTNTAAFTASTSSVSTYVVTAPAPVVIPSVITALAPANGAVGTLVTINGTGFGTAGIVMFDGVAVATATWTETAITFVAPQGIRRNKVIVTPSNGASADVASNSVIFKYNRIARVK